MKLLLWSEFYPPYFGGIETWTSRFAVAMANRGHQVTVVTSHYNQELPDIDQSGNVSILRFPFFPALAQNDLKATVKVLSDVARMKRDLRPDLIHLQLQAPSAFFHIQTMTAIESPTVITVHGEFGNCHAGKNTLMQSTLGGAAWVATVSNALLDDLHRICPETIGKSGCIYNGAIVAAPDPRPPASQRPVIVAGGRLVRDKGMDLLVTAFHKLAEQVPEAELVITGDGPERAALERQAANYGIAHRVKFVGWLPDESALRRQMASSTMLVVPSRWREGFGLYPLEAMLLGLPVIATRVGALPELIDHEQTGLLVRTEDPDALSRAILRLIEEPALGFQLATCAQARAERQFSFTNMLDRYELLYREVLTTPKIPARKE